MAEKKLVMTCECGAKIRGVNKEQLENNLKYHKNSRRHKDIMDIGDIHLGEFSDDKNNNKKLSVSDEEIDDIDNIDEVDFE